ncbi:MAG: hypothetical protein SGPRY_014394, partial [Prymnesium sp.]
PFTHDATTGVASTSGLDTSLSFHSNGRCPEEARVGTELRRAVKPKKMHEIVRLSELAHEVASLSECSEIVDLGSGQARRDPCWLERNAPSWREQNVTASNRIDASVQKTMQKRLDDQRSCSWVPGSGRVRHVAARLEPGITAHAFWKVVGQAEGQTQRNTEDQADDQADGHAVGHAEGHAEADPQELPGDVRRRRQESRSVLVGLHTCGDLASTTLRVFHSAGEAVGAVVSVGCCYMHLTEHPLCCDCDEADVTSQEEYAYVTPVEASASVSPLKGRPSVSSGKGRPAGSDALAGFPMSAHVRQLAIWAGFHTREAACHSLRSYADRLRASAHNGE